MLASSPLGVDFYERDISPAVILQTVVESRDADGLGRGRFLPDSHQRVEFRLSVERQAPQTPHARQSSPFERNVPEAVGRDRPGQQAGGIEGRLERPNVSLRPHQPCYGQRVGAVIGTDVDSLLPRQQDVAQKLDLVFKPVLLLAEHVGRDQVQRVRDDDSDPIDQCQSNCGIHELLSRT